MAYESNCAACTYMNEEEYCGKYYCTRKGEYRKANDPKCYNFCEAYSRSNYARENMYKYSQNSTSSGGCYLTTIMCQILGYVDNNYYLNTLRNFRDTKMKTNPNYLPHLLTDDIVGPLIADALRNDKHNKEIASIYFNECITRAVTAIELDKEELAIDIYVAMTNSLADRYNINTNILMPVIDESEIESLGHGKRRIKINPQTF